MRHSHTAPINIIIIIIIIYDFLLLCMIICNHLLIQLVIRVDSVEIQQRFCVRSPFFLHSLSTHQMEESKENHDSNSLRFIMFMFRDSRSYNDILKASKMPFISDHITIFQVAT